ncbi:pyrroline-5-carboxylate dehydrogenase [Artemisia annua]|uniref:Pyrroline-5-carboxylate dehydrogenase n=1 Tax=Artemisia annua TaxID=35608 RepID=A0A2U1KMJ7_ARTAN|nr:pyrroline-5-carboxylate dehydrogenase [Artemisia annua]
MLTSLSKTTIYSSKIGDLATKVKHINNVLNTQFSCGAEVITYGMGSVLSSMPRLIIYTRKKYKIRNNPTLAMAEVITSGGLSYITNAKAYHLFIKAIRIVGKLSAIALIGFRWPYGPVAVTTPFNFPLLQLMGALYMGNKHVLKVHSKHLFRYYLPCGTYASGKEDSPLCDVPEFEKSKMTLIRRVPFAD